MESFDMARIVDDHRASGQLFHEFVRAPRLSVGLYVLPAGATDPQRPHTEDEVYYVVEGEGVVNVAGDDRPVTTGSVVYVDEGVQRRFHPITEDLKLLVVFAPPLRSRAAVT